MPHSRSPRSAAALCIGALAIFLFATQAVARDYEKLDDCHYMQNPANDGDSFHVKHEGREYIFRIFFVDTPETENTFPERVQEQAAYFGITPEQALRIGKIAAEFTRGKLAAHPFTVYTRWQDARGESRLPRHFAHVIADDKSLAELLVANGLARIYGMPAVMPDGTSAKAYEAHLRDLEAKAKTQHLGAWSLQPGASPAATTSKDAWNQLFRKASPTP